MDACVGNHINDFLDYCSKKLCRSVIDSSKIMLIDPSEYHPTHRSSNSPSPIASCPIDINPRLKLAMKQLNNLVRNYESFLPKTGVIFPHINFRNIAKTFFIVRVPRIILAAKLVWVLSVVR